ncbi:MAG: SRPBCC family protein [Rhodococcus sp.]|nr:SRPBCC family protein [Rhodococcus sp. (in: high G+C Gram-positive bacteria)]
MTTPAADRDFSEEIVIHADRERVWEVLSDPSTMPKASPELFSLTRRQKGAFRVGETFIGWNRRKAVVWPTVSKVTSVIPGQELAWHTNSSGATWTYTLRTVGDTTILREARTMPDGAPRFATLFAGALLGGMAGHADELETHVSDTLRWIKDEAER